MNLSALHAHVRALVRNDAHITATPGDSALPNLSEAERSALQRWQDQLAMVEGDASRLQPVGGTAIWATPPRQALG